MMKKSANFFLWIALLAVSLLITITITQIVTQKSLTRLQQGNQQATATFTMNNRLQEMVNLAFELETKMLNEKPANLISIQRGIKDSLTRLQYNIGVLKKVWSDTVQVASLDKLVKFVDSQVDKSFSILTAIKSNDQTGLKLMTDSFSNSHWGDSIYSSAISFQKGLEQNLGSTLTKNNIASTDLSVLNRFLAGVSLLAILVLATIIIRRQVKQLSLIKDLEKARKVALQSVEAKDQFLANMSHEIRTPLNAIMGFGKILSNTPLNADQQKYTSIISTASNNLLNIVNDILDFSKIETGNLVIKKIPFRLGRLLDEVELMFSPFAQEKELVLIFPDKAIVPGLVLGDPERVKQILVNLVSNAIKFTNEGEVSVQLKFLADKTDKIKIKFIVSDTGVGIPFDKIGIIFERFEQLDDSSTRQQGGTGLGLAITKKLAEAMGGRISVKSEVNKGSIFIIDLEFEAASHAEVSEPLLHDLQENESSPLGIVKVLVAEDNKMNQLLIKSIFDNYGVNNEIVENGEEAIKAIRENKFDLILMDIQMPKIDGITAVKFIRKELAVQIPVIAMTAHVLPGEREKCIDAGMNDYLTKPLNEDELIAVLKRYSLVQKGEEKAEFNFDHIEWLNMKYLNSICGNDKNRIFNILKELQKQLPLEVDALQKCLGSTLPGNIKHICHHLKSTISLFSPTTQSVFTLNQLSELAENKVEDENRLKSEIRLLISQLVAVNKELGILINAHS
jgi:signal transduction histidine kinase/CheY-like chemotaxis protein